jgi:hypothetical protein
VNFTSQILANRAAWRAVVREELSSHDLFLGHGWTDLPDITRVLARLCDADLAFAFAPGGGGFEFVSAISIVGRLAHLTTYAGSRHIMTVARLDYVPHPLDLADAVFRLELVPAPADGAAGPESEDGFRQGLPRPDEDTTDPWPDHRWLSGTFVFTAKQGVFNEADLASEVWQGLDTQALGTLLGTLGDMEGKGITRANAWRAHTLRPLATSSLADAMPPGWLDKWLECLPDAVSCAAVEQVVEHILCRMPISGARDLSVPHFRELCERARDGIPLDMPFVSVVEQHAQLLLADLVRRHSDLSGGELSDALLVAAAALHAREYQQSGLVLRESADSMFGARAAMFAQVVREAASAAPPANTSWQPFFTGTDPLASIDGP